MTERNGAQAPGISPGATVGALSLTTMAVTTLFFAWGFITQTIDPLIASVRAIFSLTYTEALLTQFAYFMAYGVVSLPGAALVNRVGYGKAIVFALVTMIVGCLVIPLATHLGTYELVLVALFIIASGVTVLQVAANPLASALGPPEKSHFRLLLSQTFNSLGTVIAPYFGSVIMLSGGIFAAASGTADEGARRVESLRSIDTAFLVIVAMLALLTVLILSCRKRLEAAAPALSNDADASVFTALTSRWAVLGAAAIFLYVGAEVSIGSVLINFLHQPDVLDVPLERAGKLLSFYWGGAFVGRIVGSVLLTRVQAWRLLTLFAVVAAVLCLAVTSEWWRCLRVLGARDRAVQLDHVPGDLHADAGALDGFECRDVRAALHGHRRRRVVAAGGRLDRGSRRPARLVLRADGGVRDHRDVRVRRRPRRARLEATSGPTPDSRTR